MNCPKCHKEIPDGSRFCLECGSSVSGESGEELLSVGQENTLLGGDAGERSVGGERTVDAPGGGELSLGGAETVIPEAGDRRPGIVEGVPLSKRYEVRDEIGDGGFARVYRATDRKLDRVVAVKRLRPDKTHGAAGKKTIERFAREARAIAALNHRNIVQVHDTDRDDQGYYIVMEYVDGGTLRDYLKERGTLSLEESVPLFSGIARGLAYAHRHNLVHRDMKPANVLLARHDGELTPKIVDFGLARAGADSDLSMTGYGMGTPFYMPPEQRRDAKGVNHTADIYALGKILYEMVSGEIPDNVDPEAIPPPPELAQIVFRAIKSRPEERYFSVEDMLRDLDELNVASASAPSAGKGQGGTNPCPSCGASNLENAAFCEQCGTGLTRNCPECALEASVNKRFCRSCGTDVDTFSNAQEALERMQRYTEEKKWSRANKEFGLLPDDLKLPGEKGQELKQQLEQLNAAARQKVAERDTLIGQIKTAIDEERYGEAGKQIDQALELDPHKAELRELRNDLERRSEERDRRNITRPLPELVAEKGVEGAKSALQAYAETYSDAEHAAEARERMDVLESIPALEAALNDLVSAGRALADGDPKTACETARDIEQRVGELPRYAVGFAVLAAARPDNPLASAEDFAAEVQRLGQEHDAAKERADEFLAEAEGALKAARYDDARQALQSAQETYPGDPAQKDLLSRLGKAQAVAEAEQARTALQSEQFDKAENLASQAIGHDPDSLDYTELKREVQERKSTAGNASNSLRESLDQAFALLHEGNLSKLEAQLPNLEQSIEDATPVETSDFRESWQALNDRKDKLKQAAADARIREKELLEEARSAYDEKRYADAGEQLERVHQIDKADPMYAKLRGQVEANRKEVQQWLSKSQAALGRHKWRRAIRCADEALSRAPHNARAKELRELGRKGLQSRKRKQIALGILLLILVAAALAAKPHIEYRGAKSDYESAFADLRDHLGDSVPEVPDVLDTEPRQKYRAAMENLEAAREDRKWGKAAEHYDAASALLTAPSMEFQIAKYRYKQTAEDEAIGGIALDEFLAAQDSETRAGIQDAVADAEAQADKENWSPAARKYRAARQDLADAIAAAVNAADDARQHCETYIRANRTILEEYGGEQWKRMEALQRQATGIQGNPVKKRQLHETVQNTLRPLLDAAQAAKAAQSAWHRAKDIDRGQGFGTQIDSVQDLLSQANKLLENEEYADAFEKYQQVSDRCEHLQSLDQKRETAREVRAQTEAARRKAQDNHAPRDAESLFESGARASSRAKDAFDAGDFETAAKHWKEAASTYTDSATRAAAVQNQYRSAKSAYEDALADNKALLKEYGGDMWREVRQHARTGETSVDDPVAGKEAYDSARKLLPAAVQEARNLMPKLTIIAMIDDREVEGATIAQGDKTWKSPHTFPLEKGKRYEFRVSLSKRQGKRYQPQTVSLTADWTGKSIKRVSLAQIPRGGDPTALKWIVVNDRWVRNIYANGDVTMSDRKTKLMWVYDANANGREGWKDAKSKCSKLKYAGHDDWFLPEWDQLKAIHSQKEHFKDVPSSWSWYWSSTPYYHPTSTSAYYVEMFNGGVGNYSRSYDCWVWPCRGG